MGKKIGVIFLCVRYIQFEKWFLVNFISWIVSGVIVFTFKSNYLKTSTNIYFHRLAYILCF